MGLLEKAIKGVKKKPYRVFLYGVEAIGKSTWANQARNPFFLDIEDGLSEIDCERTPNKLTSFDEVMAWVKELYTEVHPHKTIVLDSADWVEPLIWNKVCEEYSDKKVESISEIGYGKGYELALKYWTELREGLDDLRTKGMSIIILAHAKIEKFSPPDQESYDIYSPKIHKSASAVWREWADAVLFARYVVHTKKTDDERTQAIGKKDRVLICNELPSCLAKNRYGMPDKISMNFSEFLSYAKGEQGKSEQKES